MAWDLNLYDLKEIANNSIRYSLASDEVKSIGYSKFSKSWIEFVDSTSKIVCENININLTEIQFLSTRPSYGPNDAPSRINLYGYGFENTLCEKLYCYFNNIKTNGFLRKINEIICETPLGFSNGDSANISIGFKDYVFQTGLKYKFVSSKLIDIKYDSKKLIILGNDYCFHFVIISFIAVIYFLCNRCFSVNIIISKKM
jgi:hypothetical protein